MQYSEMEMHTGLIASLYHYNIKYFQINIANNESSHII